MRTSLIFPRLRSSRIYFLIGDKGNGDAEEPGRSQPENDPAVHHAGPEARWVRGSRRLPLTILAICAQKSIGNWGGEELQWFAGGRGVAVGGLDVEGTDTTHTAARP